MCLLYHTHSLDAIPTQGIFDCKPYTYEKCHCLSRWIVYIMIFMKKRNFWVRLKDLVISEGLAFFIPFLIGSVFLIIGGVEIINITKLMLVSEEAEGTVVYMNAYSDSDGVTYSPDVKFTTRYGEVIRFTDDLSTNPADFKVGDTVTVIYDPMHPQNVRIKTFVRLWLFPGIFVLVGLIPIGLGIYFFAKVGGANLIYSLFHPEEEP